SESATEHALAEHEVRAARTPTAVEALLGPVIDARNPHRGELRCDDVEGEVAKPAVAAEPRLARAFADLIVVVDQGDHAVPVPAVQGVVVEPPVWEDGEVLGRLAVAAGHPLELTWDVLDPGRGVQPGLLDDLP